MCQALAILQAGQATAAVPPATRGVGMPNAGMDIYKEIADVQEQISFVRDITCANDAEPQSGSSSPLICFMNNNPTW